MSIQHNDRQKILAALEAFLESSFHDFLKPLCNAPESAHALLSFQRELCPTTTLATDAPCGQLCTQTVLHLLQLSPRHPKVNTLLCGGRTDRACLFYCFEKGHAPCAEDDFPILFNPIVWSEFVQRSSACWSWRLFGTCVNSR
jgi:hypothetical protein